MNNQLWRGQKKMDLCPICGIHHPVKGRTYCTETCAQIARAYHKRLRPVREFLQDLGFSFATFNGVQIQTVIPANLQPYYPKTVHKWLYPDPLEDIAECNAADYFRDFELAYGVAVAAFARWMFVSGDKYRNELGANLFASMVRAASNEGGLLFSCGICGKQYAKSSWGYVENGHFSRLANRDIDCCSDCNASNIPF